MNLNELQIKKVEQYLKDNKIENRLIFEDFLDHLCCMIEQNMSLGISFDKSLELAVRQLPGSKIKSIELHTLKLLNMETAFSSRISLPATIPFGLFGLTWIFFNSGFEVPSAILWFSFIASVIGMFGLFCIGWIKNFPRWSFPAIGFCPLFSLFFMAVTIPGFSKEDLGFRAWIPFMVTLTIALLLNPSWEPIKKLQKRIKEEPALILFALYGFLPFFLFILCDEIRSFKIGLVALGATLLLAAGNYFFLKSMDKRKRLFSIITFGSLATALIWFSI